MADRQVLIVADSPDTKAELKALKKYISDYKPVLIGVDAGADALRAAGHKPQLIVGNPDEIDDAHAPRRRRGGDPGRHPTDTHPAWNGCRTSGSARSPSRPSEPARTSPCCSPTRTTPR